MANIKSQKKRILTNAKRAERNKTVKSELRTRVKSALNYAASTETPDPTADEVRLAIKKIDKAAAKGVIHKNQAARRKARLMAKVNAAG
ncbi:MAG: 30S ribosomal protein S20 [Ilumatobacteraceae bacterium]